MVKGATLSLGIIVLLSVGIAALTVPPVVQMPGTQPGEAGTLETPTKCDNCHGGYNPAVEPSFNWRGSMMANATRDPLFWATLAVAEQDFDGVGDLCIRCHSTAGWHAGRSTPTDGSGLRSGDADGVECDSCHKMTNPNNREHLGVMNSPFIANDRENPATGFYGSGMLSRWPGSAKLGPYSDADARHQFMQSNFHRSGDFCGSCHDVSNSVTGDLAHNNGAPIPLAPGQFSGKLNSPLADKAAFKNFPYQYGVVERTYSEFKSGKLSATRVADYANLPQELKTGAIKAAYLSSGGDYQDGSPRYFSCQTCHMRAVNGPGCNKSGAPIRADLPLHDMTGGNYWVPDAILWQNTRGLLRLGGGLTQTQIDAINAGRDRAKQQLNLAASLEVTGNTLKITNLTGHKLITGYPEGRRMWVNVKWFDTTLNVLREDGEYGELRVKLDGQDRTIRTLLDSSNTRVYEAHYGMTKEWAGQLLALNYPTSLPLAFDRETGAVTLTLGGLANGGSSHQDTFHFALNNIVTKDSRIPPYGFDSTEAQKRNALPVPANQYPILEGIYQHWDHVPLNPPSGAAYAQISLLYQPTSWEYVQFLYLANRRQNPFLANEGVNLLNAWLGTGMAEPFVMATAAWGNAPAPTCNTPGAPQSLTATPAKKAITLSWTAGSPAPTGGYRIYYSQNGKLQLRATVSPTTLSYKDTGLTSRVSYTYVVTAFNTCGSESTQSTVTATAQ